MELLLAHPYAALLGLLCGIAFVCMVGDAW
jgi:hypothetical protein